MYLMYDDYFPDNSPYKFMNFLISVYIQIYTKINESYNGIFETTKGNNNIKRLK